MIWYDLVVCVLGDVRMNNTFTLVTSSLGQYIQCSRQDGLKRASMQNMFRLNKHGFYKHGLHPLSQVRLGHLF